MKNTDRDSFDANLLGIVKCTCISVLQNIWKLLFTRFTVDSEN